MAGLNKKVCWFYPVSTSMSLKMGKVCQKAAQNLVNKSGAVT